MKCVLTIPPSGPTDMAATTSARRQRAPITPASGRRQSGGGKRKDRARRGDGGHRPRGRFPGPGPAHPGSRGRGLGADVACQHRPGLRLRHLDGASSAAGPGQGRLRPQVRHGEKVSGQPEGLLSAVYVPSPERHPPGRRIRHDVAARRGRRYGRPDFLLLRPTSARRPGARRRFPQSLLRHLGDQPAAWLGVRQGAADLVDRRGTPGPSRSRTL